MSHQRYTHDASDDTLIITDLSGDQLIVRRNGADTADRRFGITTHAASSTPYQDCSRYQRRTTPVYIKDDDLRAILEFLKEKLL